MLNPCKDCPNRYVGCHAKCEDYIAYRKDLDYIKELRSKNKKLADDYWAVTGPTKRRNRV